MNVTMKRMIVSARHRSGSRTFCRRGKESGRKYFGSSILTKVIRSTSEFVLSHCPSIITVSKPILNTTEDSVLIPVSFLVLERSITSSTGEKPQGTTIHPVGRHKTVQ